MYPGKFCGLCGLGVVRHGKPGADMAAKVAAYIVRQKGLSKYAEIHRTKKGAMECARDMLWHPGTVTVTPLYAGKKQVIR